MNVPRASSGLPEVAIRLSDSGRAPEKRARLPTGNAIVEPEEGPGPSAVSPDGTQNSARLPKGSGALPLRDPGI